MTLFWKKKFGDAPLVRTTFTHQENSAMQCVRIIFLGYMDVFVIIWK